MKFDLNKNPIDLFTSWLDEAKITEPNDPDAMSFATVSSDGYPSVRMVLLRKFDKKGFIFFAVRGNKINGERYITQAIKKGAVAIVCSKN